MSSSRCRFPGAKAAVRPPRHLLAVLAFFLFTGGAPVLNAASVKAKPRSWPRGKVFTPKKLFQKEHELDTIILESNPRLYLHPSLMPARS